MTRQSITQQPSEEFIGLVGALLDGEITGEQEERLGELLAADPAARACYYRVIELHGWLEWENVAGKRTPPAPDEAFYETLAGKRDRDDEH